MVMARDAILHKVNAYELHGVRHYQLFISFADAPESVREARLAHDMVYPEPSDGDLISVETLLSMITEVKKRAV
jgi:hypothetical protein